MVREIRQTQTVVKFQNTQTPHTEIQVPHPGGCWLRPPDDSTWHWTFLPKSISSLAKPRNGELNWPLMARFILFNFFSQTIFGFWPIRPVSWKLPANSGFTCWPKRVGGLTSLRPLGAPRRRIPPLVPSPFHPLSSLGPFEKWALLPWAHKSVSTAARDGKRRGAFK